jgi:hypothetical protein
MASGLSTVGHVSFLADCYRGIRPTIYTSYGLEGKKEGEDREIMHSMTKNVVLQDPTPFEIVRKFYNFNLDLYSRIG